jgi:hypothetical protein
MPLLQAIMTAARAGDLPAVQAEVEAEPAQVSPVWQHGVCGGWGSRAWGWESGARGAAHVDGRGLRGSSASQILEYGGPSV